MFFGLYLLMFMQMLISSRGYRTFQTKRATRPTLTLLGRKEDFNREWVLQFDGGSRGNPGLGGSGAVIFSTDKKGKMDEVWHCTHFVGREGVTNNVAEYTGLIVGLEQVVKMKIPSITIQGDSQLIVNQIKGSYSVKEPKLQKLHEVSMKLLKKIPSFKLTHIPRAANSRADHLSNVAMNDQTNMEKYPKIDKNLFEQILDVENSKIDGENTILIAKRPNQGRKIGKLKKSRLTAKEKRLMSTIATSPLLKNETVDVKKTLKSNVIIPDLLHKLIVIPIIKGPTADWTDSYVVLTERALPVSSLSSMKSTQLNLEVKGKEKGKDVSFWPPFAAVADNETAGAVKNPLTALFSSLEFLTLQVASSHTFPIDEAFLTGEAKDSINGVEVTQDAKDLSEFKTEFNNLELNNKIVNESLANVEDVINDPQHAINITTAVENDEKETNKTEPEIESILIKSHGLIDVSYKSKEKRQKQISNGTDASLLDFLIKNKLTGRIARREVLWSANIMGLNWDRLVSSVLSKDSEDHANVGKNRLNETLGVAINENISLENSTSILEFDKSTNNTDKLDLEESGEDSDNIGDLLDYRLGELLNGTVFSSLNSYIIELDNPKKALKNIERINAKLLTNNKKRLTTKTRRRKSLNNFYNMNTVRLIPVPMVNLLNFLENESYSGKKVDPFLFSWALGFLYGKSL